MEIRWRSIAILWHEFAPGISPINRHKPVEFDPKRKRDAAEKWFEENDPEGVAFEYEVLE
jgi:hypothetical protein